MDSIIITGLRFYGCHGALPLEKEQAQPLVVELELFLDLSVAAKNDCLENTVNYAEIGETVRQIVEGESYDLIEALAERIAVVILDQFAVHSLIVVVEKPQAPVSFEFSKIAVKIYRIRH